MHVRSSAPWLPIVTALVITTTLTLPRLARASDDSAKGAEAKSGATAKGDDEDDSVVPPETDRISEKQQLGLYVLRLNKIDVVRGSFELDAVLTISTKGPRARSSPSRRRTTRLARRSASLI
ncbi:MAG: hypothetical protein ACHREM_09245 [Polyangiales bacterium]